jgi:LAO/AO transport system kinase
MVERGGDSLARVAALTWPLSGSAHLVGLTGAPGAGKSTLTNALCAQQRRRGHRVGVLAVDPTSPFSGGALLGDRVRMGDHALDDGVFIRSMATRGHLGGLAVATPAAARVLDAVGFDMVVVETVGVGQVEVEVAGATDTTVVVVNPGWGDAVQAAKAGLMEVADVFVINKADRPGAGETRRDLESMLTLAPSEGWRPPVIDAVATDGRGVAELLDSLGEHRAWLARSGEGERRRHRRLADELAAVVSAELARRAEAHMAGPAWEAALARVVDGRTDPWTAAGELLGD